MLRDLSNNNETINMMTLDFKAEIDEKSGHTCWSVLFINCVDSYQNVYLVKVTGFRTFFYV